MSSLLERIAEIKISHGLPAGKVVVGKLGDRVELQPVSEVRGIRNGTGTSLSRTLCLTHHSLRSWFSTTTHRGGQE